MLQTGKQAGKHRTPLLGLQCSQTSDSGAPNCDLLLRVRLYIIKFQSSIFTGIGTYSVNKMLI